MNILVTGCAGFIGSHLCEYYLHAGHRVVGIDNMSQSYDPLIKRENLFLIDEISEAAGGSFVFYESDVRHEEQLTQIFAENQIEAVFHFAGGITPDNFNLYFDTEVLGTLNLLERMVQLGVKHIIYASGCGDEKNSTEICAKRAAELVLRTWHTLRGLSAISLRFGHVYGPRQRPDAFLAKSMQFISKEQKVPVYGDGTQVRDFIFIDDAIAGIVQAHDWMMTHSTPICEVFDIGFSSGITVNDVLHHIEKILNKRIFVQHLPKSPLQLDRIVSDSRRAREFFGFAPKIKIEEGIEKYLKNLST